MGNTDTDRQKMNVDRMRLLGAEVIEVNAGAGTLKDAINEAFRDWISSVKNSYYLIGSVVGPHPYPTMVGFFQSIIGKEAKKQFLVIEDDKVVGLLSDGDLRRAMLNEDFSLDYQVKQIMTTEPKMINDKNILASDALKIIEDFKIQLLIVSNEKEQLVGVLHIHTLIEAGIK
jgi:CBS domain-containing protein